MLITGKWKQERFHDERMMTAVRYLLFGTGDYYERYKKWFHKSQVLALLDNASSKQHTYIDDIQVVSPESGVELPYDVIVILSFYVKAMKRQLMDLGVPKEKIYHFYDLHKLIRCRQFQWPVQYYGDGEKIVNGTERSSRKILLLSHDLNLGGPALALYHAAQALKKQEFDVVFGSMIDGPLRDKLVDEQIPVVIDYALQIGTMKEIRWISSFSFIVCNTINFHVFLSKRDTKISVLWWLHDSEFFYEGVDKELLRGLELKHMEIAAVGPVPQKSINKFLPDIPVRNLLYGVSDETNVCDTEWGKGRDLPICFVTIGYIEERKGQDILIQAIKLLEEEVRQKAVFYLTGQDTSLMALRIKEEAERLPQIVITGTLDRIGINRLIRRSDVMICPSREDPMPTVAAEAMMHRVPCIVSDATGTSAYLQDHVNGMIFRSQDAKDLSERIAWCVEHREELQKMGAMARRIYEDHFSMEAFETNFLKILDKAVE